MQTTMSAAQVGPDRIDPSFDGATSTRRDRPVRLRLEEEGPGASAPLSVPSVLRAAAGKAPDCGALAVKRDGKVRKEPVQNL